ncbi:hypothetical protein B1209_24915 [Raoultella planticola]|nr:hypothetical protein B1209_24915 [Raoultella planticola]
MGGEEQEGIAVYALASKGERRAANNRTELDEESVWQQAKKPALRLVFLNKRSGSEWPFDADIRCSLLKVFSHKLLILIPGPCLFASK